MNRYTIEVKHANGIYRLTLEAVTVADVMRFFTSEIASQYPTAYAVRITEEPRINGS